MWIVVYLPKDALHCETQYFGPFLHYVEAEDFLCMLPAAIYCEQKSIESISRKL